uniref:E1 ubiquitin-activating enzyme n=1 Tax=Sinocyclocheilus rhinocerous TaxID=307959 RepID=A0A673GJJ0_9TELE
MADSMDIDDSLYSRQRYVLGDSAMQQMAQSAVFLSGMGALGVEIGTPLHSFFCAVTLHDCKRCEVWDLGTNFFIREEDVHSQKKRVEAVHSRVAELNPYVQVNVFAIGDTSSFRPFAHGGIFRLVKTPKTFKFEMMEQQLCDPRLLTPDFSKPEVPLQLHTIMLALDAFLEQHARLPNIGQFCTLIYIVTSCCAHLQTSVCINQELVRCVSRCARGCLSPLAAAVGGIASQEVLKALTGKFSPLQQWFYLDVVEVVQPLQYLPAEEFAPRGDRYDALRACIGESMCLKLHKFRVFMVGCGAIGCEMLKNLALLGVGLSRYSGEICVTDPDLIEKSNLNRQFLFRPQHIQKPKSTTAAAATLEINPEMQIDAHLNKVCPATEDIYSDAFFSHLNLVVTALDNVEARRYVDSRSVSNQKALLDSGTMGTKGHTEIIVPFLTESYNSHRDPPEEEIPFCTLKSFPAVIEHTIQWARDKFESAFSHKPSMYNMFWQSHSSAQDVLQRMMAGESMEGAFQVIKLLSRRPTHLDHCLALARLKFDKYFKRKALQLLHSFPLDTRLKDGSKSHVKQRNLKMSFSSIRHFSFVVSAARLFADIYNIPYSEEKLTYEAVSSVLAELEVPEYRPAEKHIETDETVKKPDQVKMTVSSEEEREAISQLQEAINSNFVTPERLCMTPLFFEKDDDTNGHMDFVASASALRAQMYAIEAVDRLQTKRIAGKIIPAIATSTAAVAGLVSLELIKVAGGYGFELFKNCFFNLAIPVMVLTETAQVKRTQIRDDISFSIWDRWTIFGHEDFTLSDFMSAVREEYGIEPTMVVHGVKMLYVPVMPGHNKRLKLTMHKLIKPSAGRKYVDLTVSFAPEVDGDEDLPGPPVRYYFSRESKSGEKA